MKVKFLPMDVELEIKPDQSVMNLAHENKLPILSVCNGMPSCAECRVKLVEGEHNVMPPGAKELGLIGTGHFIDGRRLSCQLHCFGDITVDLSEQVEKASEAKVNKKFLKRAQKENAEDSHSEGGVFIEQDEDFKAIDEREGDRPQQKAEGISHQADSGAKKKDSRGNSRNRNRNRNNRNRNRNRKPKPKKDS